MLDTVLASRYYALYIIQFFTEGKKYISTSNIAQLIKKNILDNLNNNYYENILTDINGNLNIDTINKYLHECQTIKLNSWNDIIHVYTIIAIMSDALTKNNFSNTKQILDGFIIIVSSNKITHWIDLQGGWSNYEKYMVPNKNTSYLSSSLIYIGLLTGVISTIGFFYKKSK